MLCGFCPDLQRNIVTHASITARPFFEGRGYKVVKEQQVERKGIFLTNYVMIKDREWSGFDTASADYSKEKLDADEMDKKWK